MTSNYIGYFTILFCLLTPTLQLTVAVLTGNNLEPPPLKSHQASTESRDHHLKLETRCHTKISSSGKIVNCSSASRSSSNRSPESRISHKQCASNSRLVGGTCLCNPGFIKFPFSELCVKGEGERCNFQKNDCNTDITYMACINNVCSCEVTDIFDPVSSRCVGKVGGLCYPSVKECVADAECVNIGGRDSLVELEESSMEYVIPSNNDVELSGRCECKEGYVEGKNGRCEKGYGETCTSFEDCDSHNLVCKEGVCSCPSSLQVYDMLSRSCLSLVGAQCSNEQIGGTLCVKYAYCKKTNLEGGRCACVDNAVETKMRTCTSSASLSTPTRTMSDFMEDNKNEESSRVLFMDY